MPAAPECYHVPIMVNEVIDLLAPERGGIFVDGTLGGGGHSEAILKALPEGGRLYGIDRDDEAIAEASKRLSPYAGSFTALHGNFFSMKDLLSEHGVSGVDGILLDLGVSSHQLDTPERGFSYKYDAPLDMRMDRTAALSAYTVVNTWDKEKLAWIFREYGEERFANRIADRIAEKRAQHPIETTAELAEIVKNAIPAKYRNEPQHPARRVFQAVRIAVNGELDELADAIQNAHGLLNPGGILAVLTFHSLEDRIVKNTFRSLENPCVCPKSSPVCVCGRKPTAKVLTRHPLTADETEQKTNTRSTCAKLRAVEKL